MYSVRNGANRSPSRVKCAKTSKSAQKRDSTINSSKPIIKEQPETKEIENRKHTFDKKGDWSLMTASRCALGKCVVERLTGSLVACGRSGRGDSVG